MTRLFKAAKGRRPADQATELVVLHVLEAVGGGTARHLIDICAGVDARHIVVAPIARLGAHTDPDMHRELQALGAAAHVIPMRRSAVSPMNVRAILAVRRKIITLRPTVVHGHASVGGAIARLAAWGLNVPVVWTPNGLLTGSAVIAIERQLARLTTKTIAVSHSEGASLRHFGLIRDNALAVIANGIDLEQPAAEFDVRQRLGLDNSAPLVLCICRMVPQKAPLDLVAMAQTLTAKRPDVQIVMIGDGPLAADVDRAIVEHHLQANVHRLRMDSGASSLLPQADVMALSSRYEGGPYVVLESFRAGVPVVATACVGTVDAIENGVSGLLVDTGDSDAMASAVLAVLEDADLSARLVEGGNAALQTTFSRDAMAAALSHVYAEVAGQS